MVPASRVPDTEAPMPRFHGAAPRLLTILAGLGLVALAASGCGRRGGLEPPPGSAAPNPPAARVSANAPASPRALPQSVGLGGGAAAPDPDAVRAGDELDAAVVPGAGSEAPILTARGAKRGYVVPKQPFILDPLL
jgi:predicted small lipoprotein YifL